ncbi:MAG: hypothetical protein R3A79_02285 [Nannocystaceae bacterium]
MLRRPPRPRAAALLVAWLAAALVSGCATAGGGSERVDSPAFAARCEAEVLTPATPTTPAEAVVAKEAGRSWTNDQVREVYLCTIAGIDEADAELAAKGASLEARARAAYEARHGARLTSRAMMADADEVAELEARDLAKYGDKDGPTFASLVAQGRAAGKSDAAIYLEIIGSAQQTNRAVNRRSR